MCYRCICSRVYVDGGLDSLLVVEAGKYLMKIHRVVVGCICNSRK